MKPGASPSANWARFSASTTATGMIISFSGSAPCVIS
jgi:hypothetical protein